MPSCWLTAGEDYGVDLIGPTRPDYRWQASAGDAFTAADFAIDWEAARHLPEGPDQHRLDARGGAGPQPRSSRSSSRGRTAALPVRDRCTRALRRCMTISPASQFEALQAARSRESSEGYRADYARRAGIEGTISQGVRACGLRRSRYAGRAKTHLQHLATAAAINVLRISSWLLGRTSRGTRTSPSSS